MDQQEARQAVDEFLRSLSFSEFERWKVFAREQIERNEYELSRALYHLQQVRPPKFTKRPKAKAK